MPDQLELDGDTIRLGPWTVADIRRDIPATVDSRFRDLVEAADDSDKETLEDKIAEAYEDGRDSRGDEVANLEDEIAALEKRIDAIYAEILETGRESLL